MATHSLQTVFRSVALLALVGVITAVPAYADCNGDKQQALSLIQSIKSKNNAQTQAASTQLSQLIDRMSSQGCDTQLLQLYQTMQREGIQP